MTDPTLSPRPALVFGVQGQSSLLAEHLRHEGAREVLGFAVDAEFSPGPEFEGAPVRTLVDWAAELGAQACAGVDVLLPLGHRRMNGLRRDKLLEARALGFGIGHHVSPRALLPPGFAAEVGDNTLIYEGAILQARVQLGLDVTVRAGANLGHHSMVADHTFIASGVVTGGSVTIGPRCFIGLGAVIRDGVTLAERTFVGAGAVITADTEPDGVYVGVPARRREGVSATELTS
jgi:sugar O-acyltransferase (sialic acid O-acetyltransferase NeuD family)